MPGDQLIDNRSPIRKAVSIALGVSMALLGAAGFLWLLFFCQRSGERLHLDDADRGAGGRGSDPLRRSKELVGIAMNLTTLYPPIAAATVVFILWALVAYRLYKRDLPLGPNNESFSQAMWLAILPCALLGYFYLSGKEPVVGPVSLFFAALTGIGMGCIGVFAIKMAFFTEFERRREKAVAVGQVLFFLLLFFVAPFI